MPKMDRENRWLRLGWAKAAHAYGFWYFSIKHCLVNVIIGTFFIFECLIVIKF
jgi:hypothetical protein